ncbi:hypothetical protein PM082_017799 [Marasmius tenuissimus]|nr:hypothetical protein PM082_017799 [Marasmius tenuissimus]
MDIMNGLFSVLRCLSLLSVDLSLVIRSRLFLGPPSSDFFSQYPDQYSPGANARTGAMIFKNRTQRITLPGESVELFGHQVHLFSDFGSDGFHDLTLEGCRRGM